MDSDNQFGQNVTVFSLFLTFSHLHVLNDYLLFSKCPFNEGHILNLFQLRCEVLSMSS